jgi:hypothetical protein
MSDDAKRTGIRLVGSDSSPIPTDALDYASLWLDPALGDGLTDAIWTSIPIAKPKDFFRVHPNPAYRRRTEVYTHKPEGVIEEQHFILAPAMQGRIEEARPAIIATCMYRDGSPRLWPLKSARANEKENEAWSSARAAARTAMTKWVRIVWSRRQYNIIEAQDGYAPEPDWGRLPSFDQLVELAFGKQGIIRDKEHPIYRDLMGNPCRTSNDGDGL